jgi:hypothetical protein
MQTPELKVEFYQRPFREIINHPFSMSLSLDWSICPQVSEVLGNSHLGKP